MSHRYFDSLARTLPAHLDVRAVDLPGFGGTARPIERWEIGDYADHLARVIERLGGSPIILIGHSMGSQFVTELAHRRPDLVAGVVLMAPVVEIGRRTTAQQATALLADAMFERPSSNALVFADYVRTGPIWFATQLRAMLSYRIEERMPGLQMPVMVMRGERDTVSRTAWCRQLATLADDGEFVELSDLPHVAQRSSASAVSDAIAGFVERLSPRS